jgi:hexosaminidase
MKIPNHLLCLRMPWNIRLAQWTAALFFFAIGNFSKAQHCPVLPTPTVYKTTEGNYTFSNLLSVNSDNLPENCKTYLVEYCTKNMGITVVFGNGKNQLRFQKSINTPQSAYAITINNEVLIRYSDEKGCFYALTSLFQLIEQQEEGHFNIQNAFVQDEPRFQWRGLHLDVARHFFTVDEVKRYIDLMAMYKFNVFHWHLTDDQGWRIEIKKYPKLTEIGAFRDSTLNNHYTTSPRTYNKERYGGFYSQEDIKEVVAYAAKKYITVVPEIEMPGHARAAIAAYPELSCSGDELGVPGLWGVFDDIFCAHENTILFLQDVLTEVLQLFPSEYIHIGGDEAPKTRWSKCKKCQAVIRENGLKDEHELQSYFIGEMDEFLTKNGRKLIGWDEILEGGLSPNATVMSWRGMEGGIEAALQGHYVVMSPGSHCYFDHYQSNGNDEPLAIGGNTPLNKVYDFNPIPEKLTPDQQSYILGAQANVWTEYIQDFNKIEYMVYPRAIALAQVLWCKQKPTFEVFLKTLSNKHLPILEKKEVHFSRSYFNPEFRFFRMKKGIGFHLLSKGENLPLTMFSRSDEKIQSMNGGRVVTQVDTFYFERNIGEKIVKYKHRFQNEENQTSTILEHIIHPTLGCEIQLLTLPSPQYAGNGTVTLTDGIIGNRPWKSTEWLGFNQTKIELVVDLGETSEMKRVEMGVLEDLSAWIHLPERIDFMVSKDGIDFHEVDNHAVEGLNAGSTLPLSIPINSKARFLKVIILPKASIEIGMPGEGNVPWTFLDEIIVFCEP